MVATRKDYEILEKYALKFKGDISKIKEESNNPWATPISMLRIIALSPSIYGANEEEAEEIKQAIERTGQIVGKELPKITIDDYVYNL